jgi:cysteine desulfurase
MSELYYFDHAASAPRRDEVAEAMAPWLHGVVGNPSGSHRAARAARRAIEEARDEVAAFVGAKPGGVVFTAGGTESCQLAVSGVVRAHRRDHQRTEIIISAVEHHAVGDAAAMMAREFDDVTLHVAPVDHDGLVDPDALGSLVNEDTAIVSVMTVNNETGVCQPIEAVNEAVRRRSASAVTHTDAVAAAPWLALTGVTASSDLVSLCAHKLGGPVNAGVLVARRPVALDAVTPGGGQERGRRGGTVDVAAAVGLAAAVRATALERAEVFDRVLAYQEKLAASLATLPGCRVTASGAPRVPGTVHLTFEGLASDEILFLLDQAGVCASAAASCSSGAATSSHVLAAMGVAAERARGSLRLSMGAETTDEDVDAVIGALGAVIHRLAGP